MTPDRPAHETKTEIEVTPEMIEAGVEVLAPMEGENLQFVAELTFRAMINQTNRVLE